MNQHRSFQSARPACAVSRREFLATSSAALLAANLDAAQAAAAEPAAKLALDGGAKAVKQSCSLGIRWGDPERERLNAMLQQQDLFYWKGPQTALMLERFKEVCPVKYAQSCSSGTAALHIAVLAAGIGPGDEVITSPITDIGTVIGVIYQQAVPVFADLGASTYNLDPADVERRITPKTKAIIAVHLCGNPCDLHALKAIADKHKLILIEDSCQAWGAKYHGRPIGTVGDMTCFSLQNTKHITCGDGGVVGSNDERFGPLLQGEDEGHVLNINYSFGSYQTSAASGGKPGKTGDSHQFSPSLPPFPVRPSPFRLVSHFDLTTPVRPTRGPILVW